MIWLFKEDFQGADMNYARDFFQLDYNLLGS